MKNVFKRFLRPRTLEADRLTALEAEVRQLREIVNRSAVPPLTIDYSVPDPEPWPDRPVRLLPAHRQATFEEYIMWLLNGKPHPVWEQGVKLDALRELRPILEHEVRRKAEEAVRLREETAQAMVTKWAIRPAGEVELGEEVRIPIDSLDDFGVVEDALHLWADGRLPKAPRRTSRDVHHCGLRIDVGPDFKHEAERKEDKYLQALRLKRVALHLKEEQD